jgi:hypothetical protein
MSRIAAKGIITDGGARLAGRRAPAPHEGLRAGLVGATAIWVWLAVVDLIERTPLHTVEVLGRGLLVFVFQSAPTPLWADVLAFTVVHYALWLVLGRLFVTAIAADTREPGVLIFTIFLLILLSLAIVATTAVLAKTALHGHAWLAVLGGHLIGLVAAGLYLRHRHPDLGAMLRREGTD